ncbi:MAG: hypothetical protein PUB52_06855 [Lachnospiraceae bacterium]|nr:hypothetical protein [Lachnospiraceae bacterium]
MEKRLRNYLKYMEKLAGESLTPTERKSAREELLTQISFFQHERLVHLIVTVTFAVLTMLALLTGFLADEPAVFLLLLLFLVLLIPYVRHYYILENGVQKLYDYYDRLADDEEEGDHGVL